MTSPRPYDRPTLRRLHWDRPERDRLRFSFEAASPDGRVVARITALALDGGFVIDINAETPEGFVAGTSGDPLLDVAVREHIAGFASRSTPPRPVGERR